MRNTWGMVFAASMGIALVATPLLRRLALSIGFVDDPADRKHHTTSVPYLGGVAVILSVLVSVALGGELAPKLAVIAVAAASLGAVGLFDDDKVLHPLPRLGIQFGAAIAVVVIGVRAHATGIEGVDIVLTVIWIVGITNALNLVDNMDALGAGIALAASLGIFALAAAGDQTVVATVSVGIAGSCVGFLAYNLPPASIFLGDAGSLFLGFFLAIVTLEVTPDLGQPSSFLVPLLFLAVPVLDTTVVVLARLRHGRQVSAGARDHLSHRLVSRGLGPGGAVAVLVLAQLLLSSVAVLHGRGVVRTTQALGAAALVLVPILWTCVRARVYSEPAVAFPRWLRWGVMAAAGGAVLLAAPAAVALLQARSDLRLGADAAEQALEAAATGDTKRAAEAFDRASVAFEAAQRRLGGPVVGAGRVVPVLASNLEAGRGLAGAGSTVAMTGARLAARVRTDDLAVRGGALPLDEIERVAPEFARAADELAQALAIVKGLDRSYLLPEVNDAVERLDERLTEATTEVSNSALATRLAPDIFGGSGTRRYFLAIQNPAESRATGGFIGNWGELVATDGQLELQRFERLTALNEGSDPARELDAPPDFVARYERFSPATTWQNVNLSPDFPTVAGVIADLYPQSGGSEIDGVIAVDPEGLAALLSLTGSIEVPEWPEPISAETVVDVTLRDAYATFERSQREDFLGVVAEATWRKFTSADLGNPPAVAGVLSKAVRGRHLQLNLRDPEEQHLVSVLEATGATPPARGDSLLVVNQNASGNKADYYLRRDIRYAVKLHPVDDGVDITATVEVQLKNNATATGLPVEVAGPYDDRFEPGENLTFLSLYTPLEMTEATIDGKELGLESAQELGRHVLSAFISIPAEDRRTLRLELAGHVGLGEGGWYALDLIRQPLLAPDSVAISVEVPEGWRVLDTIGLDSQARTAIGDFRLEADRTVWVRIARSGVQGFWDRLWDDP